MRFQHIFNLPSLNFKRSPFRGFLASLLLCFLVAGCSSGSDGGSSFVASPGQDGGNTATTGSVTFNFVQGQTAPITVPVGTTTLRFEFFSELGGSGNLLLSPTTAYASTVTIDNVPTAARSVVITAFGADNFPVSEFTANITVPAGGSTTVSSADGTSVAVNLTGITVNPASVSLGLNGVVRLVPAATFSNGDSVAITGDVLTDEVSFVSDDPNTAMTSPQGDVVAVVSGRTVVNVSFRGQTTAVPVTVTTGNVIPPSATSLVVDPTSVSLPVGTMSEPLEFTVTFTGGATRTVGSAQGVTYSSNVAGISVDQNDRIVVGNGVAPNTLATVTGTYAGLSADVTVTVSPATLSSISVAPSTVSLPFGGFEQLLVVSGTFSDQTTVPLAPGNVTFGDNSPSLFSIQDSTGLLTTAVTGTAGQATFNVSSGGFSAPVTVIVGDVVVTNITTSIANNNIDLNPGEFRDVVVTANLSNGTSVDVSDFTALQVTTTGTGIVINGNRIVAVAPNTTNTVTYTLQDAGPGGADAARTVTVTVSPVSIVSAKYFYAGNQIIDNQLNLPRGYVGVFEVEATLSNGVVRRLTAPEYRVVDLNTGTSNPNALRLFNETYEITPVAGRFIDGQPRPNQGPNSGQGEVGQITDDLINRGVRYTTVSNTRGSDQNTVITRPTFRAVAADYVKYQIVGPASATNSGTDPNAPTATVPNQQSVATPVSPFGSENFRIEVLDGPNATVGNFTREVSVTVTDPLTVTLASVGFANYPDTGNVAVGSAREYEVRVNFAAATLDDTNPLKFSLPPYVSAQENFKLAEANVRFASDDDGPNGGVDTRQLNHVPTELGFLGITADIPADIELLYVLAQPLGGIAKLPIIDENQRPEFVIDDPATPHVGTPTDPDEYTPGVYNVFEDVFGPSFAFQEVEVGLNPIYDPGPGFIAGERNDARLTYSPADGLFLIFSEIDNNGTSFPITIPTVFTLVPPITPTTLEVGASQTYRTFVQFDEQGEILDRSLDYRPTLVVDPANPSAIGQPSLTGGELTVIGINASAPNAAVIARDVTGKIIDAIGEFTFEGTTYPATNTVNIDVVPIPVP